MYIYLPVMAQCQLPPCIKFTKLPAKSSHSIMRKSLRTCKSGILFVLLQGNSSGLCLQILIIIFFYRLIPPPE